MPFLLHKIRQYKLFSCLSLHNLSAGGRQERGRRKGGRKNNKFVTIRQVGTFTVENCKGAQNESSKRNTDAFLVTRNGENTRKSLV